MTHISNDALRKLVLDVARRITTDRGRIHTDELQRELAKELAEHEDLMPMALAKGCQGLIRDMGDRHSPRRRRTTGGLYHPDAVLKLGNGIWVWMKDATPTDITQWGRVCSRNAVRILTSEAETQQYIADRTDAFRAHPGIERLASLEEAVFHYQQDPLDDGLDGFPDTDDLDDL
ncbi:hypothetical protein [Streptomyces sp. NPDC093808]|uniref:hypothetical protein n=1 Tax=Streptomyces sp. NPDC093808 TaxID=3154985 RepID=UPI00344F7EFF